MRILYLHQYFVTPDQPGATRSYEIARRLVRRGHQVDMITTDTSPGGSSDWWSEDVEGITVHRTGVPYHNAMTFRNRIAAFAAFGIRAKEYGIRLDYDMVFATSTPLTIAWPAVGLSRAKGVPMVFEVRDLWPEVPIAMGIIRNRLLKQLAFRLERFAYENADLVIALSPGMAESISERFPTTQVQVVPNGCDLDLFRRKGNAGESFRSENGLGDCPLVVYVGTFGEANNAAYVIDVAKHAIKILPEIRFLLVGEGKLSTGLRAHASRAGVLDTTVIIRPRIRKQNVPEVLHAADVALSLFADIPILSTNSANKFFDALAAGTAIAINYGGWQAHLIEESQCGLRLPSANPVQAAELLVAFLRNRRGTAAAGVRARLLAESRFSRDRQVAELIELLETTHRNATNRKAEATSG
ncbi:MAG: glycosyltransferase family 4 protein [Rhodothermales bacterium]